MVDQRYRKNAGAVFALKYHLLWCPKYRLPVLVNGVKARLLELLEEKAEELEATMLAVEVMPDHVHIFVESDPTKAPAHLANQFKGYSSRILRSEFAHLKSRIPTLWSRSYFVGSVGAVSEATVRRYIAQQETR